MPAPILGPVPVLVTSWFCPYAQRVLIAFNVKKDVSPFRIHEMSHEDLYIQKPQWLLDLNPAGLVPCLAWQQQRGISSSSAATPTITTAAGGTRQSQVCTITESLVINEYLQDAFPAQPLLPNDPVGRAAARLLIRRIEDHFVPAFKQLIENIRRTGAQQAASAVKLDTEITNLLQQYHPEGPYALSDQLSLVDCAVAPHFLRLYILRHYAEYRYKGTQADRLRRYMRALRQHPAIAASCYHPEGLDFQQELLKKYAHYGFSMGYKYVKPLW